MITCEDTKKKQKKSEGRYIAHVIHVMTVLPSGVTPGHSVLLPPVHLDATANMTAYLKKCRDIEKFQPDVGSLFGIKSGKYICLPVNLLVLYQYIYWYSTSKFTVHQ